MRDPVNRHEPLPAVPLLVLRGEDCSLAPDGDFLLAADDEILLAGQPAAGRALDTTSSPAGACRRAGSGAG